jgi:3-hydroxyisobutyrate dehydrogenase-like beta-hydroxyacid dehydrogenase
MTQAASDGGGPAGREIRRIGLVGCGRMGRAIGRHLLAKGWPLTVTDVDPAARTILAERGATEAVSAREVAAASDLALVVVVDDAQVIEAMEGPEGAIRGAGPGTLLAVCASVRPDTCRSLAARGTDAGVQIIDVALARGERGAEAGELLLLCGGSAAVIDACRPAFEAFAADVCRIGEVGAGQVAKSVNNILLWACIRADYEALQLGRALGVEPSDLRPALALGSGANRPLAEWGQHRLRWPAKDLEVALALAEEAGLDLPFVRALAPLMTSLTVKELRALE